MQQIAAESKEREEWRRSSADTRNHSVVKTNDPTPTLVYLDRALCSYRYRWNDLDRGTFPVIGVIARRAPDGKPRFNFDQTIWLSARVKMDWAPELNLKVQTLALNILTLFVTQSPGKGSRRGSRWLRDHAAEFAELFLCTMPAEGGCIPTTVIKEWLKETA